VIPASTLARLSCRKPSDGTTRRGAFALFAIALSAAGGAHAQTLAPPDPLVTLGSALSGPADPVHNWSTEVFNNDAYTVQGAYGFTITSPGLAVSPGVAAVSAGLSLGPLPKLVAEASSSIASPAAGVNQNPLLSFGPYGYSDADVMVRLRYQFEVSGPGPSANVDLHALMKDSADSGAYLSTGSNASGSAGMTITDSSGRTVLEDALGFDFSTGTAVPFLLRQVGSDFKRTDGLSLYVDSGVYTFQTGQVYSIDLSVTADSHAQANATTLLTGGAELASAFLDPSLAIDPGMADSAAYQLRVSAGVGNVLSVPEPATWVLLLLGVGGLTAHRRSTSRR